MSETGHHRLHPPDEQRYEASKYLPRMKRGTLYPYEDKDLHDLWNFHKVDDHHFQAPPLHPVSYRRAAEELETLLNYTQSAGAKQSRQNLEALKSLRRMFHRLQYWGPDLPIKAFKHLDTFLFGGYLHGRVGLRWEGETDNLVRIIGNDHRNVMGYTNFLMKGERRSGSAEIILNAQVIFLKATRESKWKRMWDVLIHEMCHGMLPL